MAWDPYLVDEKHARDDFRFALLSPFGDFAVDLLTHFGFDFARIAAEKRQKSLRSTVYYVDFVQGNRVNDLEIGKSKF